MIRNATLHLVLITVLTALFSTACGVDVYEAGSGGGKAVDVRTPVGGVSVRTDADQLPDTGLPVYPGARVRRSGDDPGSAHVQIGLPFVGVKVAAASFEHEDSGEQIVAFYRKEMAAYGEVLECRGNIDFKGRMGRNRPVCDERRSTREIQLVVGTEERHRLVVVKPRAERTEFAVVYIQTKAES